MFYPSRVTQFVINGSRGDGKDSYSLRPNDCRSLKGSNLRC